MTITRGYLLATDAQFKELSNFSLPPRAGRITAIEASGQVRVETDDPDGGDVLAWPLNGFTYAVDDVVYLGFAVNSPDSAIVIGSLGHLPLLSHGVLVPLDHGSELVGLGDDDHTQYALLAGRSGSQGLNGGLAANEDLTLRGTAHATKTTSYVLIQDTGGLVVVGDTAPINAGVVLSAVAPAARIGVRSTNNSQNSSFLLFSRGAAGTEAAGGLYFTGHETAALRFFAMSADNINYHLYVYADGLVSVGVANPGASILGVKAGTSTNDAAVGGTLYETRTATGNAGAGETDLAAYSVPANTLSVDGMSVWFEASGSCAANLNAKTLRVRFGTAGVNLIISATVTGSGAGAKWVASGRVVRTGASAEKGYASVYGTNVTAVADVVTTLNQANNTATTLKITGQATANNDIVLETFRVEWGDANT